MNPALRTTLENLLGEPLAAGSAGSGLVVSASGQRYFLKRGAPGPTCRCEANGLAELARSGEIAVASVIGVGDDFLLTRYIDRGVPPPDFFAQFGRALARMHRMRGEDFGFYEDNFIGLNPQPNLADGVQRSDWTAFYWEHRLLYQYRLAEQRGYATDALRHGFVRLEGQLGAILAGSDEPPTLLHGDLWNGNFLCGPDGHAVLIDPAVYYGHREADLAMTRMFGGFSEEFYTAYRAEHPLPEGWERRENIYKLYHVLNHLNLFGCSYLREAERIVRSYVG